jgi:hypothetical protein
MQHRFPLQKKRDGDVREAFFFPAEITSQV